MISTDYDAIVFDNDGVLIEPTDRERLYDAVHRSFEHFDVVAEEALVRRAVEEDDLPFDDVRETHGLDPGEWWARREAAAVEIQREEIRSGTKALYEDVEALFELDHALAIVSNNQHETIEFIVEHHGLREHFETYYGRDPTVEGAERKKPDPHYVERALDELGTTDALYVGDSEKDVVAAERAGIDSAFLRREHRRDLTLAADPTYEFADLRGLVDAVASARMVEE
ncbi:haloacid dehalogenase superfamily, subfamily IA, variant 1 with third motif having Dx(3-4)D or Dx(3-4)E [Halomicrobium zhouii]|uniref:Haloacid dehalogenase superfamily, subfamily IA, variant 1 with third motif having Dx(3-4)D or Dx(3-4)E n=1 Tax=Halomicrobium zhouii TaxID=767519 RepID=A0A1I6KRN5_9EURY|nr:HAD-IA family hydrolase [Halomicrobium zhouii]SFR93688.1 haloacid dehalogenase superfamily, subfamily IA, variant 1 with third motif having Dx(3-4)D or Dx(3-4)E [Halomicrobium zhouii]